MKNIFYVSMLALSLIGCSRQTRHDMIQTVEYHRDNRTGLCFATYGLGMQNGVMTNVPCTSEVEKLLVK